MLRDVNWCRASGEVLSVAAPRFLRTPHKPVSNVMRFVDKDGIVHQTSILQDAPCRPMPGLVHIPMERVVVPRRFSVSDGISERNSQEDPTFFDVDIAFAPFLQNWDVWFPHLRKLSEWFPTYKRLDQASRQLGKQLRRDMSMDQLRRHAATHGKLWDRLRERRPTLIRRLAQRFDPQDMIQPHLPLSVITVFLSTWTVRFQLWHLHREHVLLDGTQEYDLREFLHPSALGGVPLPKRYVRLVSYLLTAFLAKHRRSDVYTPVVCLLGSPLPVEQPKNVEDAEADAPHIRDITERVTAQAKGTTRVVGTFRAGFALQAQAAYQHFREGSHSAVPDMVFDLQDLTVGAVDITGAYGPLGQLLDVDVSQHTDSAEEATLSKKICPRFITESVNNVLREVFQRFVREDFYEISPLNIKEIIFLANLETTLTEAFGLVQLKYGVYFSFDVLYLVIAACRVFVHRAVAWAASLIIGVCRFLHAISRRRSFRIAVRGGVWEWRLSRRSLMHYVERLKPRDARWTILLSSLEGPENAGGVALLLHQVQAVESSKKSDVDNIVRKFVDSENYHEAHEHIKDLISDELEVEEAASVESSIRRNTWLTWVDHLTPANLSGFGDTDVERLKTLFFKANPSVVDVGD